MTPQQFVGLAVRLFSIWLILLTLQTFGIAHALSGQMESKTGLALYAIPVLVLLVAVFLWNFPMAVAHKLVPRTHDANTLKIPVRETVAAASAIIGVWVIIAAFPHLMATFGVFFLTDPREFYGMYFTPERIHQLLTTVVQVGFGFFLIIKPWFIASKVFPAEGKTPPESTPESPPES